MKFNELEKMMQKPEPKPDTYEAGMALNQLLKIGSHAIKIHNMIDDGAEMEAWVAKKIDLASNYVKSVHGYTAGSKTGTYDDDGMSEGKDAPATDKEIKMAKGIAFDKRNKDNMSKATSTIEKVKKGLSQQPDVADALKTANEDAGLTQAYKQIAMLASDVDGNPEDADDQWDLASEVARPITKILKKIMDYDKGTEMRDGSDMSYVDVFKKVNMLANKGAQTNDPKIAPEIFKTMSNVYSMQQVAEESVSEDAGEGHMSKSQLYQTAKMAIELLDMINKGDDLEGWVQTKLNLAADYLQAVYHYEDYQKLNPYREELDGTLMQRHAGIIQKHLDEILERKCRTEDVDTKPGMMRILKKRVNEVEKEIAKENRKESQETTEAIELEEGIKEWGKRLAMAGIIVAGLAGVNSINNAIDNSIPAVKAMNTALEMAQDSGNTELAKMIEKDLSDAKIRLNSGKDLSHVADLQDKYAKFMKTEGLAYESILAVSLKQRLK